MSAMIAKRFLGILTAGAMLGSWASASQDVAFKSSPLKGISALAVLAEELSEDGLKLGLNRGMLLAAAKLRLEREKIGIGDGPAEPCLYITVAVTGPEYSIRVELRETAVLTRIPIPFTVTTWYAESYDDHGGRSDAVLAALGERLDGFVNDFYKANPRK